MFLATLPTPARVKLVLMTIKQHSLLLKSAAADKRCSEELLGKDSPDNSQVSINGVFMTLVFLGSHFQKITVAV